MAYWIHWAPSSRYVAPTDPISKRQKCIQRCKHCQSTEMGHCWSVWSSRVAKDQARLLSNQSLYLVTIICNCVYFMLTYSCCVPRHVSSTFVFEKVMNTPNDGHATVSHYRNMSFSIWCILITSQRNWQSIVNYNWWIDLEKSEEKWVHICTMYLIHILSYNDRITARRSGQIQHLKTLKFYVINAV